jgi:hypothetical protein
MSRRGASGVSATLPVPVTVAPEVAGLPPIIIRPGYWQGRLATSGRSALSIHPAMVRFKLALALNAAY